MLLELKNITKKYKNLLLFEGLNLELSEGEKVALIGNNGSGKTSLIHIICNLISFEGLLKFKGKEVKAEDHSYKHKIGLSLSEPHFFEKMKAREYLQFAAGLHGLEDKQQVKDRIDNLLHTFEVEDGNKKLSEYSTGNRIKISLAAAMIHNPVFLVLDEPFVHLDTDSRELLKEILQKLNSSKTLLVTSHSLKLCADVCDRYVILDEGSIIHDVKKADLPEDVTPEESLKNLITKKRELSSMEWLN
ncbi:ABC transporter ATP-binding protein [Gracilimonas mengyeensis]|uniref:ABC-2 type transport system ATP-binding protein n=1 Tax=Gracilimonas mengyeensis TaxID=1302730 RepID=A0A521DBX6_9BACT|nr:ABC transporter ATP-binding protein [Gracilimonas mengyeensis]SMO69209.1 ABC-2 type transport system ATP-binding protein [Gracilimonas mengyeensis]